MDRHRQRAADGLRVAKGHMPFAADGKGFHPQSVGQLDVRLDPATFNRHDGSRDTVESSHGRGPLPG